MSAAATTPGAAGLYGKMPAHGDFVRRGLPADFVAAWDGWAQRGIAAASAVLGPAWPAAWDAAPLWRFALPAGACGASAVAGVLACCRDGVGRRFPLVLAAPLVALGGGDALDDVLGAPPPPATAWFDALEALAMAARDGGADADGVLSLLPGPWPPAAAEAPEAPGWWHADAVWPLPALPGDDEFHFLLAEGEGA